MLIFRHFSSYVQFAKKHKISITFFQIDLKTNVHRHFLACSAGCTLIVLIVARKLTPSASNSIKKLGRVTGKLLFGHPTILFRSLEVTPRLCARWLKLPAQSLQMYSINLTEWWCPRLLSCNNRQVTRSLWKDLIGNMRCRATSQILRKVLEMGKYLDINLTT